jgi:hypothetical protein
LVFFRAIGSFRRDNFGPRELASIVAVYSRFVHFGLDKLRDDSLKRVHPLDFTQFGQIFELLEQVLHDRAKRLIGSLQLGGDSIEKNGIKHRTTPDKEKKRRHYIHRTTVIRLPSGGE